MASTVDPIPGELRFPALFYSADAAAAAKQRLFLNLIRAEYFFLFLATILSLDLSKNPWYFVVYALVFVTTLGLLLYRLAKRPEQDWYKTRALAESVKTSTWRYVMKAEPFSGDDAKQAFRGHLAQVFKSNQHIGERLASVEAAGAQATPEMESVRELGVTERRDYYIKWRIADQRGWYCRRAQLNADHAFWWGAGSVTIYVVALFFVLAQIVDAETAKWTLPPLIMLASTTLGWMQIKKFSELASAYTLTAHEIGLVEEKFKEVNSNAEVSHFVNEAELAFSREHTQWAARQNM